MNDDIAKLITLHSQNCAVLVQLCPERHRQELIEMLGDSEQVTFSQFLAFLARVDLRFTKHLEHPRKEFDYANYRKKAEESAAMHLAKTTDRITLEALMNEPPAYAAGTIEYLTRKPKP